MKFWQKEPTVSHGTAYFYSRYAVLFKIREKIG